MPGSVFITLLIHITHPTERICIVSLDAVDAFRGEREPLGRGTIVWGIVGRRGGNVGGQGGQCGASGLELGFERLEFSRGRLILLTRFAGICFKADYE